MVSQMTRRARGGKSDVVTTPGHLSFFGGLAAARRPGRMSDARASTPTPWAARPRKARRVKEISMSDGFMEFNV